MGALAVSGLDSVFLAVSGLTSGLLAARSLYSVFLKAVTVSWLASGVVAAFWLDSGLLAASWTMFMVRSARKQKRFKPNAFQTPSQTLYFKIKIHKLPIAPCGPDVIHDYNMYS